MTVRALRRLAAMTRRSPYVIALSPADRAVLEQRSRAYTASLAAVVGSKIVC